MTEEIIIINGVNVAGCNFRLERDNKQKCECCHATGFGVICDCEAWYNCYYKQLKRIKQQNLELIKRANAYPKIVILANERLNEIARLEQENKELKAELNKVIDEREKKIEETLLKGCYQSFGSECRIYELKESKYRSALEEIREDLEQDTTCESRECGCDDYAECLNCIKETILNRINEVLKEKQHDK